MGVETSGALTGTEVQSRHTMAFDFSGSLLIETGYSAQRLGFKPRHAEAFLEVRIEGGDTAEDPEHDLRHKDVRGAIRKRGPDSSTDFQN